MLSADLAAGAASDPAPALVLQRIDGSGTASLSRYCGRVVVLELWTSDCRACAPSLAALDGLGRALPRDEFAALAVNVDDDVASARAFLAARSFDVPMFWGGGPAVEALSIRGVPTAVVIDRSGTIRARIEGFTAENSALLRSRVESLLAERRPAQC